MKERVMITDVDTGEIYSYNGGNYDITWKTVIDYPDSELDCTVLSAEGVIVIARYGWTLLGEEEQENDVTWLYVRTYEAYVSDPNPWATGEYSACNKTAAVV